MSPKKESWLKKLKEMPKNQLLIGGLVGILLLVIAIPTTGGVKTKEDTAEAEKSQLITQKDQSGSNTSSVYEKRLERRLTEILAEIAGVGKVEVMITLKDTGENVVEKDSSNSSQVTTEEDGTTKRGVKEEQSKEETVSSQTDSSSQIPFVSKEMVPQVEGVLVVAEGGGNAVVVKNISDAVLALFPIEVHKIKVVKMNL